jgi:hypothetical protein
MLNTPQEQNSAVPHDSNSKRPGTQDASSAKPLGEGSNRQNPTQNRDRAEERTQPPLQRGGQVSPSEQRGSEQRGDERRGDGARGRIEESATSGSKPSRSGVPAGGEVDDQDDVEAAVGPDAARPGPGSDGTHAPAESDRPSAPGTRTDMKPEQMSSENE